MKNFKTQGIIVLVVLAMLASFIVPATYSVAKAQEANKEILAQDYLNPISETELPEELTFEQLESFAYFFQEIKETPEFQEGLREELPQKLARGKATIAAKVAAKAIKAGMKKIGKNQWGKLVKKYAPLVAAYLSYDKIVGVLDVVTGFSGTIENALTKGFVLIGINRTVAGMLARLIIFLVL